MKRLSQSFGSSTGSGRHTSVCCGGGTHPTKRQTKVSRTLALLVFLAASVVPVYGQEINTQTARQTASEQTIEELKPGNTPESPETKASSPVESSEPAANQKANDAGREPFVFPTKRERFNRYVKSTVGPFSLVYTGVTAGLNQWRDKPEEWEQGASGYAKRYASGFGRNAIQQTVVYGLDSALGLDTGFRKSARRGFFPRMKDALAANITSRTKSGKRVISVPRIAGVYTGAVIAHETWYPERYNYKDGLRAGTNTLLLGFGLNLVREFVVSW